MAFQTGTATSMGNFFTQLRAFATSNAGFTDGGTDTINTNTVHRLSKAGIHWSFEETLTVTLQASPLLTENYARMRMTYSQPTSGTGFTDSIPIGQPRFSCFGTFANAGPYTGHIFYTEGDAVHAALEVFPNVFQHLSFGSITKFGTWTGGEYLTAGSYQRIQSSTRQYASAFSQLPFSDVEGSGHLPGTGTGFDSPCIGFVRYDQTGTSLDDFAPIGAFNLNNQRARMCNMIEPKDIQNNSMLSGMLFDAPNQGNLRTPLFPMYVRLRDYNANTPSTLDAYFVAGVVPGVRMCNISELNAKEIINTNWQTYPVVQKIGVSNVAPISDSLGFAYERIA